MSEHTGSPEELGEQQGTFVGGTFGTPEPSPSAAEQTDPADDGAQDAPADVEGVTDEEPPGERNEPV